MEELLNLYAELIKAATDEQVVTHLSNLVQDAGALAEAVKNVVEAARQRAQAQ